MILRISFLSFFFFLNIQINSYKIKPISDQYLPCQHEIGIMYPYIVYSLCGAENKYVFQKVKAYTNNSDWHMESLEDTYLIQPQTKHKKEIIQLTIISQTYFIIESWTLPNKTDQTIRAYELNPNRYLFSKIKKQTEEKNSNKTISQPQLFTYETNISLPHNDVKWEFASNGSTYRLGLIFNSSIYIEQEEVSIINLSFIDFGFNLIFQNLRFTLHLQQKEIGLDKIEIFEVGVNEGGDFLFFLGSLKKLKVFQMNYTEPIELIKLQDLKYFAVLGKSYIYKKQNMMYVNSGKKKICSLNISQKSALSTVKQNIIICQQPENCFIINQECEVLNETQLQKERSKMDVLRKTEANNISDEQYAYMKKIEQNTFFDREGYLNTTQFAFLYADQYMEDQLKTFKNYTQSPQQQINNCVLKTQTYHNRTYPSGIQFNNNNKDWKVCRVGFDSIANFLIYQQQSQVVTKPYHLVYCQFANFEFPSKKCFYSEFNFNEKKKLIYMNTTVRLYIFNHGQTYDLIIRDLNREQLQRVFNAFLYVLLMIVIIFLFFGIKTLLGFMCLYYGWTSRQPRYYYPLSTFQLKIKLRRLKEKGYFSYKKYKESDIANEVTCCFCLQQVEKNEKVIQIYCKHEFHASCYENWVRNEEACKCPVCKRGFSEDEINDFRNSKSNFKESEQFQISEIQ